jgi:hypothetical protein
MNKSITPLIIMLLLATSVTAQLNTLGSWNIVNLKYNVNNNWSVFAETQVRSLKFYDNFHYYEYKGGVNYKAHKQLTATFGVGSYQTFKEGGNFLLPKNNNEFRLWPQISLSHNINKIKIEQRYRAEFRFTSNGYRNRYRYRLGLAYPFGKLINGYQPFQFNTSNELFFGNKEPYFERNRLQFSFNYKPSKTITWQAGYINQFDYKINDEIGRSFFQIGLFIELFKQSITNKTTTTEFNDN